MWVPSLPTITGDAEEKLAAAATTRLLCELPALQEGPAEVLWGQLLAGELQLLAPERMRPGGEESAAEEPEEAAGDLVMAGSLSVVSNGLQICDSKDANVG